MSNNVSSRDNENLKKDAVVVPFSAILATLQGRLQEETEVVKPSPVLPKKNLLHHL
jgi:hypothetical protein